MPIYEYQCDTCGTTREIILRIGEAARPTCASCRKRMRRIISPTSFILKGSGWYVTDYPSDARKKGVDGEKPTAAAKPATDKKETASAGEKPASPVEKKPAVGATEASKKKVAKNRS